MPDKPSAEVSITEGLVRTLLRAQSADTLGDLTDAPLRLVAAGWDSEIWRLGDRHAVRLPRRALAAPLILHEQTALPVLAPRLAAVGVAAPLPVVAGRPRPPYPWPWSVVPWFEGRRGLDVSRAERAGWVPRLAAALRALHRAAPADAPANPVRGIPLARRDQAVRDRLDQLRASRVLHPDAADTLDSAWRDGLAARPQPGPPVWIHGDLHPGNIVTSGRDLRALIDFGDVTSGDPAYDLAVAWLAFDADARERLRQALDGTYDDQVWVRARAWAAAVAALLLTHSDDNPDYALLGSETVDELGAESTP